MRRLPLRPLSPRPGLNRGWSVLMRSELAVSLRFRSFAIRKSFSQSDLRPGASPPRPSAQLGGLALPATSRQRSEIRSQQSGVRTTPFAKPQGVPPKTQARYMGTRIRSRRAIFPRWINESGNRHNLRCTQRLASPIVGFVQRAHFRKGVSAYA